MDKIESFTNDQYKIDIYESELTQESELLLNWIFSKKNSYFLYDFKFDFGYEHSNEDIVDDICSLFHSYFLPLNLNNYKFYHNNFYILITTNTHELHIFDVKFLQKYTGLIYCSDEFREALYQLDSFLYSELKQVYIHIPFEIGNIFSKNRYHHELNIKYMESLISYRSSDKDRRSILRNYKLNQDHALLNEYCINDYDSYQEKFAYFDFITLLTSDTISDLFYVDSFSEETLFDIFDSLNYYYCKVVFIQQESLYAILKQKEQVDKQNKHKIKLSIYDLAELVQKNLKHDSSKNRPITPKKIPYYYKKIIDNKKKNLSFQYLWLKSENMQLSSQQEHFFKNVVSLFPRYTRTEYREDLLDQLNAMYFSNSTYLDQFADILFGENSTLYDRENPNEYFFLDIEKSFKEYIDLDDKIPMEHLFNSNWIEKAQRMYKKLQKSLHTKQIKTAQNSESITFSN